MICIRTYNGEGPIAEILSGDLAVSETLASGIRSTHTHTHTHTNRAAKVLKIF
jgi:hypothetical protein